ncbi:MAG: signal peptide peptidase SppA [Bacteroidales bacterium]
MKNFLIYTLATITGIILASLLFFFIMLGALGSIVASGEKPVSISKNSVLVLKAGVPIPDRTNTNPWAGFDIINMTMTSAPGLNDILNNIEKATRDEKIKGILIENGLLPSGWATTSEIREALKKFRESGKFVLAYADYVLTQQGYYLSASADRIFVNPGAMIEFKGLSGEVMFYKKALDKIGVDVQVIRHGKFKGAVEPYILDQLSKENREQIKDYVGSIWNQVVKDIADDRKLTPAKVNMIADSLLANDPDLALNSGLVDGLIYRDQLIDSLKIRSGLTTNDKIEFVPMSKYTKIPDLNKGYSGKKIAVIYAEGTIVMGDGNDANIGGDSYAQIIRQQRKDTTVKAIVLRVNSPGGNAIASDIIWRELELARKEKPVVISMGNYAASGGYFISAPASKIYASPTTITGSIGVFGLIPNAEKLLRDKIGITTETVNTNKYADFPSLYRPMESYEKDVMQKSIETVYDDFITKVSEGRKIRKERVDSIGQGRVWAGVKAPGVGLVDEFGGLKEAIKGAAGLAGLDKYSIREYPVAEDPYAKLLSGLSGGVRMNILRKELGSYSKFYDELKDVSSLSGVQLRLPYFIEIK